MRKNRLILLSFSALLLSINFLSCKSEDEEFEIIEVINPPAFKIDVGDNYFAGSQDSKMWFILSDLSGEVLAFEEIFNGKQIEFKYPENFSGDKIYLTKFYGSTFGGENTAYCFAQTYIMDIDQELKLTREVPAEILGNSTLKIDNLASDPDHYVLSLSNGGFVSGDYDNENKIIHMEMGLHENPDNVMIRITPEEDGIPKFKWIPGVEINKDYVEDFLGFEEMKASNITIPENDLAYFSIRGIGNASDRYSHPLYSVDFIPGVASFPFYHTTETFSLYDYFLWFAQGEEVYEIHEISNSLLSSVQKPSLGITILKKGLLEFSFNTEGEYDYYSVDFNNRNDSLFFSWSIFGPESVNVSGAFPELPKEIIDVFPFIKTEELKFWEAGIAQHLNFSGYDDFLMDELHENSPSTGYVYLGKREGSENARMGNVSRSRFPVSPFKRKRWNGLVASSY